MTSHGITLRAVALLAILSALPACVPAIAAGVGAGAAIAYSERGVSSTVEGSAEQVFQRSQDVFQEMGITETGHSMSDEGAEHELRGTQGDLEITVDIQRESDTLSSVEVFAQESTVEYDRDYAREVLERIIGGS